MLRPYPRPSHRSPPRTGTTMYGRQHAAPLPTTISQITTQNRDNHVRETACCAPTHNHLTNHNPERDNHVRETACCAPTHNHLTDHHPEPGQPCTGDSMLRPYPRPSHKSPPRPETIMYGTACCAPTHDHLTNHPPEPGQSCTGDTCCAPTHNHL